MSFFNIFLKDDPYYTLQTEILKTFSNHSERKFRQITASTALLSPWYDAQHKDPHTRGKKKQKHNI